MEENGGREIMVAESQSRYGIMQSLNDRKIAAKNELASLESELRTQKNLFGKESLKQEEDIRNEEQNYKINHQNWKKIRLMDRKLLEQEKNEQIQKMDVEIAERDSTFEEIHKRNLEMLKNDAAFNKDRFEFWEAERIAAITSKKETIIEIDKGINSLKEISKEQREKD